MSTINIQEQLNLLGLSKENSGTKIGNSTIKGGRVIQSHSPVDGSLIGSVDTTTKEGYQAVMKSAEDAFQS